MSLWLDESSAPKFRCPHFSLLFNHHWLLSACKIKIKSVLTSLALPGVSPAALSASSPKSSTLSPSPTAHTQFPSSHPGLPTPDRPPRDSSRVFLPAVLCLSCSLCPECPPQPSASLQAQLKGSLRALLISLAPSVEGTLYLCLHRCSSLCHGPHLR